MNKKVYISGPMSGYKDSNLPAFFEAAKRLSDLGYTCLNPADITTLGIDVKREDYTSDFEYYMAMDLPAVCKCDIVATLPGWERSRGANTEVDLAKRLNKTIQPLNELIYDGKPAAFFEAVQGAFDTLKKSKKTDKPVEPSPSVPHNVPVSDTNSYGNVFRKFKLVDNGTDSEMEGYKNDQGKPRWELLPGDALTEVVKVLNHGAKKYKDRNWESGGMAWGRCYGALMRHANAFWMGEDPDEETGISHMAHATCCCLFLLAYQLRGIGKDDRWKVQKKVEKAI